MCNEAGAEVVSGVPVDILPSYTSPDFFTRNSTKHTSPVSLNWKVASIGKG